MAELALKSDQIEGVKYSVNKCHLDERGLFTKFVSEEWLEDIEFKLSEAFYSDSHRGVIRGLHLQINESGGPRIVTVQSGEILDVLLDLRKSSPTYLNIRAERLSVNQKSSVYVPEGVAHGFQALESSRTLYLSTQGHNPSLDTGIQALSIDFDWPLKTITISERDQQLPKLADWISSNSL